MRAAADLPIERADLDDAHGAIRRRRRHDRAGADEPALLRRLLQWNVSVADRKVGTDRFVDRPLKRLQTLVLRIRQVKIHARGAILVQLDTRHQRAVKSLKHERVEQVRVGVQLAHHLTEIRIDQRLDLAVQLERLLQQHPDVVIEPLEPGDIDFAIRPVQPSPIGKLPAPAGKKRLFGQQHAPWCCVHDLGDQRERVGMGMIERA